MSNHLIIDVQKKIYQPGESLSGSILWDLRLSPENLTLSLGWWTEGKGSRNECIVDSTNWRHTARIGKESFGLNIPRQAPYSFSGRLISVCWALQLSAQKGKVDDALESILVTPIDVEIDLTANTYKSEGKSISFSATR